jgi:D-arabinose 1-dehydrogenase-like Zn-dependent alcohol dehydrogenase
VKKSARRKPVGGLGEERRALPPTSTDMKGRVAVLRAYGGEFELREYPVPDVEPGVILVRLTRAGICGSDLHIWRGEMKDV